MRNLLALGLVAVLASCSNYGTVDWATPTEPVPPDVSQPDADPGPQDAGGLADASDPTPDAGTPGEDASQPSDDGGQPDAAGPPSDGGCTEPDQDDPDGKTTLCHIPPGNPANAHTLHVGSDQAVAAHLKHGDTLGPCPTNGGAQ